MLVLTQENIILYVLLALVVYMFMCNRKSNYENFGESEQLSSINKIDTNMCSPDCCGTQWPVSFTIKSDERVDQDDVGEKYIPTNMTCTGLRGRGCVCAEKGQYEFLQSRGNNA